MKPLSAALQRFNRALDLIPFVETHPGWSIEELAQHFNVTAAEISKDLATLHMCGLPGYSHLELIDLSYDDDLVTILNGQNLSEPRDLSMDERAAILLGLEMLKSLDNAAPVGEKISALQERFRSAAVQKVENQIDLSQAINAAPHHATLLRALEKKAQLDIEYVSARSDSVSQRHLAPISLYQIGGHLFLEAFCFTSNSIRHFRSDRIRSCALSELNLALPDQAEAPNEGLTILTVLLDPSAKLFLEENLHLVHSQELVGDQILVRMGINDVDWLLKALLALPASCSILEPISAIERMSELANRIRSVY